MTLSAPPRPKTALTGIQATGEPHLGNYVGAIRPALELAEQYDTAYFIADYHALTTVRDPQNLRRYTRSVAATWLAAGLDPGRTVLYRQSDVPEIYELAWVLACFAAKGMMNRAHAYKAAQDRNRAAGNADLDAGVNMGLYQYPILMAADILIMGSELVPVARDQFQHVEYAADMAGSFNAVYGERYRLTVPHPLLTAGQSGELLLGTDGRKMSKSYGNTIPLFAPEAELRRLVRRMPTDSTPVEGPKKPDDSAVFLILARFGEPGLVADTRDRLTAGGMGWGELKDLLFTVLNEQLGPMRERYTELVQPGSPLDSVLADGARRARERARVVLGGVREAIGIG
ncbi:MAG TPA: tryptophan--tRNA ligase [Actinocrinis sp.]|nr:tryptophan--tRNA ligase [Actinocrinis sp.]